MNIIATLKAKPIAKSPKEIVVKFGREPAELPEESHPAFLEKSIVLSDRAGGGGGGPSLDQNPKDTQKKDFIMDRRKETTLDRDFIMKRLQEMTKSGIPKDPKDIENEKRNIDLGAANLETLDLDMELPSELPSEVPSEVPKKKKMAPVKKVKVGGPKPAYAEKRIVFEGNIDEIMIGNESIEERMPPPRKEVLRASSYYMNNRRLFQQKLADLFKIHKAELMKPDDDVNCDFRKDNSKFELLTHQKIVSDYLNLYSPYRGLLIYHGLGSGKTCTSIAIAEGMKSDRPIYILTPASLSMNYMSELKKCGDPMYKKNQFWEFVDTRKDPGHVAPLAIILSLTEEFVKSHGGVWMVNVNKESNFDEMSKDQQEEIEDQIDEMIKAKYRNVNYNANNFMSKLEHYGGGANPFDNSVVIVDEGHNLVSRIVNKLSRPQSNSVKLYKYLMSAVNAKVVFLSGTPIINYPNEIAILFNMLRGYIKTWTFRLKTTTSEKINRDEILKWFDRGRFKLYDFVDYSGDKLTVTRNPYGFVNVKKRAVGTTGTTASGGGAGEVVDEFDRYGGVTLGEDGKMSDADFEETIKSILKKNKVNVEGAPSTKNHTALPDDKDEFLSMFIDPDTGIMKNVDLFQRRILGLTSYFKSAQEKLLPKYSKARDFAVVKCPMEEYQFAAYAAARKVERDKDTKKRQRTAAGAGGAGAADLYDKIPSTYRVFSRAFCNFVFPDPPGRPMPSPRKIKGMRIKTNVDEKYFKVLDLPKTASIEDVKKAHKKLMMEKDGDAKIQEAYDNIIEEEEEGAEETEDGIDASEVNDETGEETKDETYAAKIDTALKYLKDHETEYLVRDRLQMYSSKMLNLIDNVDDERHAGLHLIYSQFRTLEGIGIIKLILEANGYAEFKLIKRGGEWAIKPDADGDEGKPKFVLYTGTETSDEKEIIRNIYNSAWKSVPATIKVELEAISNNNYMGEIIKIFMITASGAEGINLENTRYVHIVEPYWHPVRTEQVVGRARRICSHANLPEELRNVQVFLYLAVLTEEQKTNKLNIELRTKDISRKDNQTPVTTDEYLYEISNMKDDIAKQILKAVKETAMDCSLHKMKKDGKKADDENLVCYSFGKVTSNEFGSLPVLEMDAGQQTNLNVTEKKIKGPTLTVNGVKYIRNKGTDDLYDAETMELAGTATKMADGKVKIELL